MEFSHSLTSSAAPERIWAIWTDVAGWPSWDSELVSASLAGGWALGASGRLRAKGGPEAAFTITEYTPGASYTFSTRLPLAELYVRRSLARAAGQTSFSHTVSFTGPLGGLFGLILGRGYRAALPAVMERIRTLAEAATISA